eukprot:13761942-Alexandrium_andersonii.AAC.1
MSSQSVGAYRGRLVRSPAIGPMRELRSARSWTPTLLGASALGGRRVGGSACAECIPSRSGTPRRRQSR